MTLRTLSGPTTTAIAGPVTAPGWLAELQFESQTVRISSFGTVTWNSLPFVGASFTVDSIDDAYMRARLTIFDYNAAYRTIALQNSGIRNRAVKIWKAYAAALGASDPVELFTGVGDSVQWSNGKLAILAARLGASVLYAPRKRIGPATGFNFLAPQGTVIAWGDSSITLGG